MEINAYLYTVYPKTVLKNIPYVGFIYKRGTFKLTKEAVLECMKGATVYRRFGNDNTVKVTTLNIDRLHNEKFMTEEEWNKIVESQEIEAISEEPVSDNGSTNEVIDEVEDVVSDPVVDPIADAAEPAVEESVDEAPVEVETTTETATNNSIEEVIDNDVNTESATIDKEEVKEEDTIIDDANIEDEGIEEPQVSKVNINYNGKKNKHK